MWWRGGLNMDKKWWRNMWTVPYNEVTIAGRVIENWAGQMMIFVTSSYIPVAIFKKYRWLARLRQISLKWWKVSEGYATLLLYVRIQRLCNELRETMTYSVLVRVLSGGDAPGIGTTLGQLQVVQFGKQGVASQITSARFVDAPGWMYGWLRYDTTRSNTNGWDSAGLGWRKV